MITWHLFIDKLLLLLAGTPSLGDPMYDNNGKHHGEGKWHK